MNFNTFLLFYSQASEPSMNFNILKMVCVFVVVFRLSNPVNYDFSEI